MCKTEKKNLDNSFLLVKICLLQLYFQSLLKNDWPIFTACGALPLICRTEAQMARVMQAGVADSDWFSDWSAARTEPQ